MVASRDAVTVKQKQDIDDMPLRAFPVVRRYRRPRQNDMQPMASHTRIIVTETVSRFVIETVTMYIFRPGGLFGYFWCLYDHAARSVRLQHGFSY